MKYRKITNTSFVALEILRRDSLLLTTTSAGGPDTRLTDLGMLKSSVDLGTTK